MNGPLAKESGHWYTKDGSPCYEVPCKSRPGEMRATTVKDARALNLVPSVSGIVRLIAKPGLERWKLNQMLHAALTLPRLAGEQEDAFAERVITDSEEQSRKAREKGTAIHGAIERAMRDGYTTPEMYPFTHAAFQAMEQCGINSTGKPEHSFASKFGYGGKVDLFSDTHVIDFKTKGAWMDADEKRGLAYDEHAMQLVAYARGLDLPKARLINIFIDTDNPGHYFAHEWLAEKHEHYWQRFLALLTYWKLTNGFS